VTVRQWLSAHEDGVLSALSARLRSAVDPTGHEPGAVADELARTGERLLGRVLDANTMTRAHALDVLCADALLTYAFEAAADEPSRIAERADAAMRRIAALAEVS
jgi:hypothetical protein